jgi:putative MATE family efflux protein
MPRREILRRIFIIAIPSSVQFLVNYLQISTDMAFVGHYNVDGLSAIQNARVPYFLLMSFFLSLNNGTNILIAQSLGAKRQRRARRVAEVAFFYNQLISWGYFCFWLFCAQKVLSLVGAQGHILQLGVSYVRIMSFAYLLEGAIFTSSAVFQGRGKTIFISISALLRTGINIPLNWCLIYGHWGFPALGVSGSACATMLCEFIGGGFLVFLLLSNKDFPISFKRICHPVWRHYKRIMKIGLPNGLESLCWSIGNTGILTLLNKLHPEAAGQFAVINVIKLLTLNMYFGLGVATMTLVGMAVGAKNHELAKRSGLTALYLSFTICFVIGLSYMIAPRFIIGIFVSDAAVITQLIPLLYILFLALFPQAFNVVGGNSIRARGDTKWMFKTQIFGTIVIIPLAYIAMFTLHLGLPGLIGVIFFDEFWRSLVNYAHLRKLYAREKLEFARSQVGNYEYSVKV